MQFIQYESINWCKFYLVKAPRKNARIFEVADSLALTERQVEQNWAHLYEIYFFTHGQIYVWCQLWCVYASYLCN